MSNINTNLQNYRVEVPTANISEERPDENVFKRAENVKNITAYGVGAQVIYVNNKRQKADDRFAGLTKDFISDGGLKEKLSKYNSSVGVNTNGNFFRFTKKGSSLATNFPAESNYQQLTTYNVDLKVNDKARVGSADNTNLEAIANRRIFNIMDKKSKELIRYENNNSKNPNKLEGLYDKAAEKVEKSLKDQKSKSVGNISKEKPILKAKEREREKERKEEKQVLRNNFFEKPKSESNQNTKLAVVYSKKGEHKNNQEIIEQQSLRNDSDSNYQQNNQIDENENYEDYDNENLNESDNDNNDNLNIEQTKRQNFISSESNYNNANNNSNNNNNLVKLKAKPKSLPKDQHELKQELKLKRNNYLENQKKFAANIMEQNMKKMKEQQANKNARSESAESNQNNNNNNNNKEKPLIIPGRKATTQNSYNSNTNSNYIHNINNNHQNKSRITNPTEKTNKLDQINKILTTEERLENIEKINECFEKLEIKKVERESMDKIKKKVVLVQKKLRVLQEKGIELNLDETNNNNENNESDAAAPKGQRADNFNNNPSKRQNEPEDDEEEKNYVFHDSDNNVEKENISSKNLYSNSDNDMNQINNANNNKHKNNYVNHEKEDKLNFENVSKIKNSQINNYNQHSLQQQPKKPVVDTLEFVKKIQESRRKFASKSPGKSEVLNRSDSFRRSNSESNQNNKLNSNNNHSNRKNKFNVKDYEENEYDENDKENNLELLTSKLLAAAKNNNNEADKRRKDLEIKQFIERKKKEKKMVELKIQEENRKNWENKVIQLLQLEKTISNKNEKVNYVKKSNNSSAQNYSRQSNSANKVRNDFYIGTKKPNLNNNLDESSILDPDDFYYTVLESKNIIVTQKSQSSNKINSISAKNSNKSTANDLHFNLNNNNFKTSDDFQKQNALSRLSDFTQGNHNDMRKNDFNYNLSNNNENNSNNRKNTNLTNKLSQENFLKFITENEKITLRSLDSKNSGNNLIASPNNNNYDYINQNAEMKQAIKNLTNANNISHSPSNMKLTTDSKLIGSKSSNFNPVRRKGDNLFENNLENNAKKQQEQQNQSHSEEKLSNKDKELTNSPLFDGKSEISPLVKKTEKKLAEKNQADLSDLNPKNSLSERLIDRSDFEKDSFLLQFDNLLMSFGNKLKQVYLRKHLSVLINNIIMQEQIKFCFETLSNFCNVGKRSVFNRLREYANEVHVENIYSYFNNLTLFAKRNAMKSIFQYFAFVRNLESENNISSNTNNNLLDNYKNSDLDDYKNLDTKKFEEQNAQYLAYFVAVIERLFLMQKKEAIERVFEYAKNFSLYNDLHFNGSAAEKHEQNLHTKSSAGGESHEDSEYSSQDKIAKYYEYFKSTFDLMTRHIRKDAFYRIKEFKKSTQQAKLNESQQSYNSNKNENTNRDNNSSLNSERKREKIVLSKKSANGENSFSSVFNQNKAHSFFAPSHNSSNFSLHPNSLDSPKIRKLQFKIAQKNMEREWLENIDEKYGTNANNKNNISNDLNDSNNNNNTNQQHNRNAYSANEDKSNRSYSNNNLNLLLHGNNLENKDNPLVRSDDENEESKNINYSRLSLDDPFKDSKKKFYEANNSNENININNKPNNQLNANYNNNNDNTLISNKSNQSTNKNNSINVNKYSTVNYNEELNINLGGEAERKKPMNSESSQLQHNNRYGSSDYEDINYNKYNENSFNSALSKKKNLPDLSPKLDRNVDAIARNKNENTDKTDVQMNRDNTIFNKKPEALDAAGNIRLDTHSSDKPKSERDSIHEEIVEDIIEDNLDVSTSNRKKHSLKDASGRVLGTDVDLSADRDNTSDIDWIYTVSQSKSGSLRDITGNLAKPYSDLTVNKNEDNNLITNNNNKLAATGSYNEKNDASNLSVSSASFGYQSENNNNNISKKSEKEISVKNDLNKSQKPEPDNINNTSNLLNLSKNKKIEDLESKVKEIQIDAAARKNTEEDYENNYDDFENIEEDIIVDEEPDFSKILGEDSTSNVQHGSLMKSRNSLKNSGNVLEEKEKEKEIFEDLEKNKLNAVEDIKKGLSQNAEEKETDLTNKKVNLNVIPGKETIDSVRDIKSIESDDNDFFRIKNNNNQNILNLLDDKSSNNKSVSVNVLSQLSPDMGLMSDNTSSYNLKDIQLNKDSINTDSLTALDKKSENTISTLNRKPEVTASKENLLLPSNNNKEANNAANKRYENIENSAKKSEMLSSTEKEYLSIAEMDSLSSELAEKILNDLIASEVKDCEKNLIPKKVLKSEAGLVMMLNSLNNTPLDRSLASLDNSVSSTINNTLFSKTVVEQKKENSMKLYIEQIGPKLIDNIVEDITKNFSGVCENLNMPYRSDSKEVIVAMSLRDRNRLKQSYKYLEKPEKAKNFVNKKNILENFETINKTIREDDNIISDNYYDNILNECLVDAANEILEKERVYGEMGEPLAWSSRTRITKNKISNSEFSKNKIAQGVKKELSDMLNYRMGMITENYDYLQPDQINQEREKRSINHINKELNEVEELWKNYEFEETQVKLELSELVLEQLLNEIVEIFEHIHNARKKPDLYQYKSIYACEEIPRLPFQQTNTDIDLDNINQ